MSAETDWSAVADSVHREWVDSEREEKAAKHLEELQDEIERLNGVVAAVSDYADQLTYNGKWANASDEQIERNRIALELRNILGETE
ncbi:hypothetical protein [Stenotrophomonas sp. 59]|uniref:hypothetical protein n=1 Tax=Stenotrophomonas sp. 59 TaxID=3051120 RepID=UPI00256EE46A|nr:hypothetical protein [Stenotrophomonas sp. 59]